MDRFGYTISEEAMKKLLILFAILQFNCGPVININLEPIDDWKTEIFYYQGTPIAISQLKNSILTTYSVKTPAGKYQLFLSAKNLSDSPIIISYENVSILFDTNVGPIKTEVMDPSVVLSKKIKADNLDIALTAVNAALSQTATTSGTVGGSQVNLTTTQSGYNPANAQIVGQKISNSVASTHSLKNSLLFKNTIFPGKEVSGLCYVKMLPIRINTPQGSYSTDGIKINGLGVNIKIGNDSHMLSFKLPKS